MKKNPWQYAIDEELNSDDFVHIAMNQFDREFSINLNGIMCVDEYSHIVKDFIRDQIDLAEKRGKEREKQRCLSIIEAFSNRHDFPILEDVGLSAPYPAPCARKTCDILADRIK